MLNTNRSVVKVNAIFYSVAKYKQLHKRFTATVLVQLLFSASNKWLCTARNIQRVNSLRYFILTLTEIISKPYKGMFISMK